MSGGDTRELNALLDTREALKVLGKAIYLAEYNKENVNLRGALLVIDSAIDLLDELKFNYFV